jgi:uncharacterized membrane protein YbhN (UPF0104 family)
MDTTRRRSILVGFVLAAVVLGAVGAYIGTSAIIATLQRAAPGAVGVVVAAAVGWLIAWGVALHQVAAALGIGLRRRWAVLLIAGGLFWNNITPFGPAGGEPVAAYLLTQHTDTTYERALATVASVDTINLIPSVSLAGVGTLVLVGSASGGLGEDLRGVVGVVLALVIALAGGAWVIYRYRRPLRGGLTRASHIPIRAVAGVLPRVRVPTVAEVGRVATDRRRLIGALAASTLGWGCQMVGLLFALRAVGVEAPIAAVVIAVPLGAIAGITPLPGGIGGIETVLVVVLVALPAVVIGEAIAAAAVVIFRGAIYLLPVLVGGVVTVLLGVRSTDPAG